MQRVIESLALIALFVVLVVAGTLTRQEKEKEINGKPQTFLLSDDTEEEVANVEDLIFEKLAPCTVENSAEYEDANDFFCIYNVDFRFTVVRIYLQIREFDRPFKNLKIRFKMDDTEQEYMIKTVLPNNHYEILLPRGDSNSFQVVSAEWELQPVEISERKEFGFPIWLEGVSTLKYVSRKSILVRDTFGYIINELELDGVGTIVVNQGADYYQEVN